MDDDSIMRGFLRLRPADQSVAEAQANPLHVGEWELPGLDGAAIRLRAEEFEATGDPISAIESFMLAMRCGVYPPESVLRWLADAFERWHDGQGKDVSLERALGLVAGVGKQPAFKAALIKDRNEMLMLDMDRLIHLGATLDEAASAIAARLEQTDWNRSKWELPDLGVEALKTLHASRPAPSARTAAAMDRVFSDRDWVASWLKNFPLLYLPEKLKSML